MKRIKEGQAHEFFRRLASQGQDAVLAAIADSNATIRAIKATPEHGGLGRRFSEQAIRDALLELNLADIPILMALVQDTAGIMDTIAAHEDTGDSPTVTPAYGVPFPKPRRGR
jgi:hypothetical protein